MNARSLILSAAVAAMFAAAVPARAELVRLDFTGANSSPGATNAFGTPVPTLTGYVIYDSDTPASGTTGTTATNYANAIKEISFALSNAGSTVFSGSRVGSFGSVQVRDATGSDTLSFNNMLFSPAQLEGEVPTIFNGTATRTFTMPS